jgi:H/ACA ribonucleoprotein complex subunit 4
MSDNLLPFEKIERVVLVRKKSKTNSSYGKKPIDRTTEELINSCAIALDKPKGPTSHQVAHWTKCVLDVSKAGQAGTLDPGVTGLLPIATDTATKILQVMLTAGKEYICYMHIHDDIGANKIRKALHGFLGKIRQLPPVKSAVKREWRNRRIYYIDILEIDGREVLFKVGCQAGTYIRKLCFDMGQALGCGAHMAQLIRTKSAGFKWEEKVTLQDLADAMHYYKKGDDKRLREVLLLPEELVRHMPKIWVVDKAIDKLTRGVQLRAENISKVESQIQKEEQVAIMSLKGELVALAESRMTSKEMVEKTGVASKMFRVIMEPEVYRKK